MGKSTINGPFSMAMLNNHRVYIYIHMHVYIYIEGQFPYHVSCSHHCVSVSTTCACVYIYYSIIIEGLLYTIIGDGALKHS